MDIPAFLTFCESAGEAMRRDLEHLVALESPSHDKAAVDRCGGELADMLRAAGGRVTLLPQHERGDHLRVEFPGDVRRILLLGHFDTVWDVGQLSRMPIREADGRLYGPGIFDMKAGIVVAMTAVRALRSVTPGAMPSIVMWDPLESTCRHASLSIL